MKARQLNVDDWLRQEAHVAAGRPFQFEDCSCVPVVPEMHMHDTSPPVGFLVTHGADVSFVPAQTADGRQIMTAWTKSHHLEEAKEGETLPPECWYG